MIAILENLLIDALRELQEKGVIPADVTPAIVVTPASDPRFGDFSSNIALTLARPAGMTAADIAKAVIDALPPCPAIGQIAVDGPGFINFFYSSAGQAAIIEPVLQQAAQYGRSRSDWCRRLQLESITASPAHEYTLSDARSAALAATLANMFKAAGCSVRGGSSDSSVLKPNYGAVRSGFSNNDNNVLSRGSKVERDTVNDIDRLVCVFPVGLQGTVIGSQEVFTVASYAPEKLQLVPVESVTLCHSAEHTCEMVQQGSRALASDLLDEIGEDSARFLFLMRKPCRILNIDLQLAGSQSSTNPVYKVQLAHALICSVLRQQEQRHFAFDPELGLASVQRLQERIERDLIALLAIYPQILHSAAMTCQPWRLTEYITDLAKHLQNYYKIHKVLVKDVELRHARVSLLLAIRQVLSNALGVIGVSVPEVM
ncbi:MAG: DALR anticodon-binding domain-containing protein [Granulosicoccus sp.]